MYNKILIAVDGSEHSLRATDEALKIASLKNDSVIEVVFVAEFSQAKDAVLHSQEKEELELSRRRLILPVEERLKAHNLTYEIRILHGEPAPTIIKYANEGDFDLAVIGSRGLNTLQEMVLGSVSHKVVKRVDCPVLVVK